MSLLKFLKENKNARKIFGKRELKIIEKQLFGVNLTQSEKNRLSRDIRKKFEFINEASKFEEESKLKKGIELKKKVEEAKEIILNDILFKKIKKITFRSDIDLAAVFDKINLKEATLFRKRVLGKSSEKVDIQVYNTLPKKIKKEIDKKGKILYEC